MPWLLIAATPTLLMLLTVGLERIETGLSQLGNPDTSPQTGKNPRFPAN